ncbi:2-C-methyl-D-erythritol 2,4-cyclodiphosphate synthase [candidate division GN15 bacterium]|nr:2-C-methyl-D-erythritol 2,4-cyclodiphosphate synthase [candidate division GN15 bacterium]
MAELRIGHGFDVHALVAERPLIIGGVTIPHEKGLAGHSDADVLTHAIMDALLGAAGLGDIGTHFPPTQETWRDADSLELLKTVVKKLKQAGLKEIVNIDATLMAQQPRLAPHLSAMRTRLASAVPVVPERISLKATTTEYLGFVGREEGIAASAVCLITLHG